MNYLESLEYLDELSTFGTKLGLGRIKQLVTYLDNPQTRYKTIHITGTNGKGSTSSMLSSILTTSNIKTGLYISPHLVSYTERIQIDGNPISEEDFADCISAVKTFVDKMVEDGEESPTQFEVITAAAFLYFAINKVEYAVIEVGLGGLLDSTNVVKPEVSVITNVAFEHAHLCGGTLEGIAEHKAGIIKDGVPVVTAAKDIPLDIINQTAEEKNADIQEKIDNLYSIFEREIASYKVVMRQKKILPDYLKHAKENNKKLQEELERLMLTYIFDETYAADVRSFASDISGVETAVLPTLENFEAQVKPFSELEKIFEKSLNTLSAVENGQVEVFENLQAIEKNEAKAREELDIYVNKLHVIKRYMEKRNLPGIPQSFLSVFFSTSAQIEALMDELSRGRINIDAVMRLTETSKNAIDHLEETAYLVVQNATLTEQLLQYSNRYRSFEPAVQSSFEHALKLFEVDHDYDASLEEISYALETVEPGVTDRFVSSYEKTREQIRM